MNPTNEPEQTPATPNPAPEAPAPQADAPKESAPAPAQAPAGPTSVPGAPVASEPKNEGKATELTPEIEAMAGDAGTEGAKGGMRTKIMAAKAATKAGCAMAITRGDRLRPLKALQEGAAVTWFNASSSPQAARKQWIAGMRPEGKLIVDEGAARALRSGKSLLPAGVRGVTGAFQRGDPVTIETPDGDIIAVALSGYVSDEARLIAGLQSDQIEAALGHPGRSAMAHRDDMVLWS